MTTSSDFDAEDFAQGPLLGYSVGAVIGAVAPLDRCRAPAHLCGANGGNRARGNSQIAAEDDQDAVLAWLANFRDRPSTLAVYRREAERLLLWCWHQHGKPLSSLTHEDMLVYEHFLSDPQPRSTWVCQRAKKPSRSDPDWRPFATVLNPDSRRFAMQILKAMFVWLTDAGYLRGNPLALARRARRLAGESTQRFLTSDQWRQVQLTVMRLPTDSPQQALQASRCRWLFSLLYLTGLRVSEVCGTQMGAFSSNKLPSGEVQWWLTVVGKGQKRRRIPAVTLLIEELRRYKAHAGLPDDPTLPLVGQLKRPSKPLARTAIHEVVKDVLRATAQRLRSENGPQCPQAAHIEEASTHWMRHTAATHMSDQGMATKVLSENLGHASEATTSIYNHNDERNRHRVTEQSAQLSWQ